MCYSILYFTPSQKNDLSVVIVLIQKVPLNSYLCDVIPPAQMITCQFLLCVKQYTIRRKERRWEEGPQILIYRLSITS